jgi:hypothetical protein
MQSNFREMARYINGYLPEVACNTPENVNSSTKLSIQRPPFGPGERIDKSTSGHFSQTTFFQENEQNYYCTSTSTYQQVQQRP